MTAPLTGAPPILVQAHSDIQGILDRLGIRVQSPFELIPAVLPTIAFERPTPTQDQLSWGRVTRTAIALENSHCGLFNPLGSGKLIHVDSVIVSSSGVSEAILGEEDTQFTTAVTTKNFRDRRVSGVPSGILAHQTNVGQLFNGEMLTNLPVANTPHLVPIDCYLGEGQGVGVVLTIVNLTLRAGFYWEESPPAEL